MEKASQKTTRYSYFPKIVLLFKKKGIDTQAIRPFLTAL